MKNKLVALAMASAMAFTLPATAQAAQFINFDGTNGTFGFTSITDTAFTHSYNFETSDAGKLSATLSSIGRGATNVDFTSVTLNGTDFDILSSGFSEIRQLIDLATVPGMQTLTISGTSGGNGSYDGVLALSAVPEPATWALMIAGLGIAGTAMRRKIGNQQTAKRAALA